MKTQGFDNSTIREIKKGKPHIVFIDGCWRVSSWKPGSRRMYYDAHAFVQRLNAER